MIEASVGGKLAKGRCARWSRLFATGFCPAAHGSGPALPGARDPFLLGGSGEPRTCGPVRRGFGITRSLATLWLHKGSGLLPQ